MQAYNFEVHIRQDANLPVHFSLKAAVPATSWEPKLLQATQDVTFL